ncbi:DinB family protein [Paenibacillus turpanensis]|uniref:DinB family protein n=1 Tax=Paenibacillus turpanensis TaxID=2689078 RepID=UPI001408146B|nr:DinB family protein [Paenibacillus turpanensis]
MNPSNPTNSFQPGGDQHPVTAADSANPAISKLRYHIWATRAYFAHLQTLPKEVFDQEVTSVFPNIRDLLHHLYYVDMVWFKRMTGEEPPAVPEMFHSLIDAETRMSRLHWAIGTYMQRNSADTEIRYQNSKGEQFANTLLELVEHMANHGTYHRGNMTAMLRQMGHKGASTDYILYLRERQTL